VRGGAAAAGEAGGSAVLNIERYERYIAERRLIGGAWLRIDAEGRELACYWAALAPDGADRTDPSACPAGALPAWLARLLPWVDDAARTEEDRYAWAARLVPILRRAGDPRRAEALRRADYACRAVAVREARRHVEPGRASAVRAIDGVLALLGAAAAGEDVAGDRWSRASAEARESASAEAEPAAQATGDAGATWSWAAVRTARAVTQVSGEAWGPTAELVVVGMLRALEAAVGV
jgi:hypothetical protein